MSNRFSLPIPARLAVVLLGTLALAGAGASARSQPARATVPDFTFIHCSDIHVPPGVQRRTGAEGGPKFGSAEVVAQIKSLAAPIELRPYGVTVPPPSFAIATGDLTEFGGLSGWWEDYLALWKDAPFPVYHESGNHDATWACQRFHIRQLHGGAFYSFDRSGCHFIGWDSATPQDPRPSFGEEEVLWLREDLKRVAPTTPVFLFCHHPFESSEFASRYERDRVLDLLRPYNLAALLVGHGHAPVYKNVDGVDQVMGGSTFGSAPGYSVVSVKDGVLRVAYRRADEPAPSKPLLERPLPARSAYPAIRFTEPVEDQELKRGPVALSASIAGVDVASGRWEADDETGMTGELRLEGGAWKASLDTSTWDAGAHYLRVLFRTAGGATYQRTTRFSLRSPEVSVLWRARLAGSAKGAPAVAGDTVYVGDGSGRLSALQRRNGKERWHCDTGGEILARPLITRDGVYVGSGDGTFYALGLDGRKRWELKVGHPVYSPAVETGGKILVAANNGHVYALDAKDGHPAWESSAAGYSIESAPFVSGDTAIYGAWDGFVHALALTDGTERWKTQGAGAAASQPGVARYYSPADAPPVVLSGQVWIADRMFRLTVLDAATGQVVRQEPDVSAVALSEDGRAVYLRGTKGQLRKVGPDWKELWSAPAQTSIVPTPPTEKDGVVYTLSSTGRLHALAAADGRPLWQYQVTPRLYTFGAPEVRDGVVYVTGMDGTLTALRSQR